MSEYKKDIIGRFTYIAILERQDDIIEDVFRDVAKAMNISIKEVSDIFDETII